jgi:DNA polymerase-3 subunit gamma/tau
MRDGLSLLDQALASAGGRITLESVEDMLGTVEQRHLHAILEALAAGTPAAALAAVGEVFGLARDLSRLLSDLAEVLHRIALIQQVPDYRDDSRTDWEQLAAFAAALDPEDVQLYYQIAVIGRRDLGLAPSLRSGCEMTLLRMFAFRPAAAAEPVAEGPAQRRNPAAVCEPSAQPAPRAATPQPQLAPIRPTPESSADSGAGETATGTVASTSEHWAGLLRTLDLNGPVRAVAAMMELARLEPGVLEFRVSREDLDLLTERFRGQFNAALERHFGQPCRVDFRPVDDDHGMATPAALAEAAQQERQADAEHGIASDATVQRLKQDFGAELVPGSVRPLSH